jgi:hypothetical protein
MKRKYSTINEEIIRIKSLFNDGRLYGNLVEQRVEDLPGYQHPTGYKKKGPPTYSDWEKRWYEWDAVEPYLEEKIKHLADNYYGKVFEPAIKKVNKNLPYTLTYQNYDNPAKLENYKYIWEIVKSDYDDYTAVVRGVLKGLEYEWEHKRRAKLQKLLQPPAPLLGISKTKSYSLFATAQAQWKQYGAENPKTGRDKIPEETVNSLKVLYNDAIKKWKSNNPSDPLAWQKYDRIQPNVPTLNKYEIELSNEYPYKDIIKYNKNIDDQKTLIPQYCKKSDITKTYFYFVCENASDCGTDDAKHNRKTAQKIKAKHGNGMFGYYPENRKTGRKYGFYLRYYANAGKDPFTYCDDSNSKGVWVYDEPKVRHHCGCYQSNQFNPVIHELGTDSEDYLLGFNEKIYEWRRDNYWGSAEMIHDILQILAIAALFIPIPGVNVILSAIFEGVDGLLYFAEGDPMSGFLCLGFMFLPGFTPLVRNMTTRSITRVYKVYKYADRVGKTKGPNEAYKYLTSKIKKMNSDEIELLDLTLENSTKVQKKLGNMSKKEFKQYAKKEMQEWYKKYKDKRTSWGKGSKFIDDYFNPSMLEKFIFAGMVLSGMYLDKSGKMENFGKYVVEKLVQVGWVDEDVSAEETEAMEEIFNEILSDYENVDFNKMRGDTPEDRRKTDQKQEEMALDFLQSVNDTVIFVKKVYDYDVPNRVELFKLDPKQKKDILDKFKGIPEMAHMLRDFDHYKWAQLCKGKNKLSISPNITPELEEYLNDEIFNMRRIKTPDLGGDYQYASDSDGLWYSKKTGENSWKLVTDCMNLLKIETAMEKEMDSDIDTKGEVWDIFLNYDKMEYKDFK